MKRNLVFIMCAAIALSFGIAHGQVTHCFTCVPNRAWHPPATQDYCNSWKSGQNHCVDPGGGHSPNPVCNQIDRHDLDILCRPRRPAQPKKPTGSAMQSILNAARMLTQAPANTPSLNATITGNRMFMQAPSNPSSNGSSAAILTGRTFSILCPNGATVECSMPIAPGSCHC